MSILKIAVVVALAATVAVLFLGLFSLMKGGSFNARFGNKLMRLRVVVQGVAVALVAASMLLFAYDHFGGG